MNKKTRTSSTASEGTSVRLQHSTAAILVGLFTLLVFCCGSVAGEGNASSISSEDSSVFPTSISAVSTAISAYSSHSVEVNSSSENGKYKIYLRSTLGMIFHFSLANRLVVPVCNMTKDCLHHYMELCCGVLTFNQSSKRSIILLSNPAREP